jgi:hypothetical protein
MDLSKWMKISRKSYHLSSWVTNLMLPQKFRFYAVLKVFLEVSNQATQKMHVYIEKNNSKTFVVYLTKIYKNVSHVGKSKNHGYLVTVIRKSLFYKGLNGIH